MPHDLKLGRLYFNMSAIRRGAVKVVVTVEHLQPRQDVCCFKRLLWKVHNATAAI